MEDTERVWQERPDGVNKKRLADLDLEPKIAIYHKVSINSANTLLVSAFPREAFVLFSKAAFESCRKARDNDVKFEIYQIRGGDPAFLRMILDWIQDCLDQQSITKFKDIPEPEKNPFEPTLKVIEAANLLDIPAGSLQYFLEKRLEFIARKHLMPFSQIREFYTEKLLTTVSQDVLKHVACSSIFNAWWDYRLDATVNPGMMEELADLREEIPQLDQDLHQACKNKEEEVKQKKQAKRNNESSNRYHGNGNEHNFEKDNAYDSGNFNNAAADVGGWDNSAGWDNNGAATVDTSADWNAPVVKNDSNKENVSNVADASSSGAKNGANGENHHTTTANNDVFDWADEAAAESMTQNKKGTGEGAFASVPNW